MILAMDFWSTMQWADTALTIAQLALFVGGPTTVVAYLAVRVATKAVIKMAVRHAMVSLAAGTTATAAAYAYIQAHQGGGAGDLARAAEALQVSAEDLASEQVTVVVRCGPEYTLSFPSGNHEDYVSSDTLGKRIGALHFVGNLQRVASENECPNQAQWVLEVERIVKNLSGVSLATGGE